MLFFRSSENLPFTEKYRPQTMEDLILPDRIANKFQDGIKVNLLMYGSAGIGKTTTAKVIINQFKHPYKWLNASLEARMEVLQDLENFCATYSLVDDSNSLKIVVLDEAEKASSSFIDAIRGIVEKYAATTRFVATTNYINKLPEAFVSRFEPVNFNFDDADEKELIKKYAGRVKKISTSEGIEIDIPAIKSLVRSKFPDMRSILNTLEAYKAERRPITLDDIKRYFSVYKEVFQKITAGIDPVGNYQYFVSNYSNKVDDVLNSLGVEFIEYIKTEKPDFIRYIPNIIICVCDHQTKREQVLDPVINMLACVYQIQNILASK